MAKKALIIGISGQDGAYLAYLLLSKGYEVHGTSRDSEINAFPALDALGVRGRVKLHSMALRDFRSVMLVVDRIAPDEVYNLGGQSSVGLSFNQPVETFESIAVGTVHGQHADHAIESFKRHGENGAQRGEFCGIAHISGFGLGIAIDDQLAFFGDPAAQPFSKTDIQRRELPEVIAAHQFGQQPAVLQKKYGHRIVMNHFAQPHGKHGERFAEAERVAEILAELEHGLRFLARRGN